MGECPWDLLKYKHKSGAYPFKTDHLAAALVSMLFLETAMFAQFGSATPKETQNLFIMLTGGGISIIVVVLSVYTIVHSSKKIRSLERST